MKKLLAVLLALSTLLLFAGCGGMGNGKPDNTTTAATTAATTSAATAGSTQPPKGFLEIFTGGTYHVRARAAGGTVTETFARDGMKASLTTINGIPSKTVLRDGKMHIVTDQRRLVLTTGDLSLAPADVGTAIIDAASSRLGEGTADFAGKSLPYEEYGTDGNKVQCFLEDGRLVGVRTINKDKTVDTEILLLSLDAPAALFDIPSDYMYITA